MRLTVAASVGAKVCSVACTLAQVPVALHALGTEAYGLWITLMSVIVMLNFVDFGLGVGMQRAMATAFGRDDAAQLRRAFCSGALALAGLGLAAAVVGVPVALLGDWAAILRVRDPALQSEVGIALAVTLAAAAAGLPFNAAPRLAAAAQRGWLQAGWSAIGSAASLGAVVLAARAHWGFVPFLALTAFLPAAQGAGLTIHLWRTLGWRWREAALLPRADWRSLVGESLLFAVPQAGLAFLQAVPLLALSVAAGPAAVTSFNLLQRLYSPLTQGQILHLTPLWPAMTEAQARGDRDWVRRAFGETLLVALGCGLGLAVVTAQSETLLRWWVGGAAAAPAATVAWLTCAWFVLQVAWQPSMYLLVGVGRLATLAWWGGLGPGLSLLGMLAGVLLHGGAAGVLLGGIAGLAAGGLPGLVRASWLVVKPDAP